MVFLLHKASDMANDKITLCQIEFIPHLISNHVVKLKYRRINRIIQDPTAILLFCYPRAKPIYPRLHGTGEKVVCN